MHLLYPSSPLRSRLPDEQYHAEVEAVRSKGFEVSLFSFEAFQAGDFRASPLPPTEAEILYRGWMLSEDEYGSLVTAIRATDNHLVSDTSDYLGCHHLPNWYPLLSDLTPETRIYPIDCDLATELRKVDWNEYFIKDYVKSLKTSTGSRISRLEDVELVVSEMRKYRGTIEGGFCVRRVEEFVPDSERRFFVMNGKPHAPIGEPPAIVLECACRVKSRFFSVDVVERIDGMARIVEIGDGQVSDLVGWSPEQFAAALSESFAGLN